MNRFTRALILFAYIFTAVTSIVSEGMRGYPATVTVTERKTSPRTQYITTAGIPKHLVPSQFHQFDLNTLAAFTEPPELPFFFIKPEVEVEIDETPVIPGFSGRAPPAV
ncbi:MAG: hypothetical protein HBSAPP04_22790 [Ignavibacteriaceae bacterium]|nr:MAG: hypothetical protein EDM75_08565 [Chlorobiota bacterium]GJQ33440.1 MAG: hypothetical protein HBSAPP04_22790 [Ignavibacteriaceae bacterium]